VTQAFLFEVQMTGKGELNYLLLLWEFWNDMPVMALILEFLMRSLQGVE
jgi:hypothetical protein